MKKPALRFLKIALSVYCFCTTFLQAHAQAVFQEIIDSMYAYDAHKVVAGTGYVFGGVANFPLTGPNSRNSYVVRTNLNGDTLWTAAWAGTGGSCSSQYQNDLCPVSDGGVISVGGKGICGDTTKGGNVTRFDQHGNIRWAKYFAPSCDPYPCIQSSDGHFVIGGYISGGGYLTPKDAFITKLDSATGDTLWSKRYGGPGSTDWFYHILQTPDGGYLAAGKTNSFGQGALDIYLVKTDGNGNLQWSKTYGTAALDEIAFGHCLQPTTDGGYIICGTGGGGAGTGSQSPQGMFLMKVDASGNMTWAKYYAGQEAHGVKQTADKGFVFTGDAYVGLPLYQGDVILVKTDSTGTVQWSKAYGSTSDEQGLILELATDGGMLVGGTSRGFGTGGLYIVKTDPNGNSGCNESNPAIASTSAPFIQANAGTLVSRGAYTVSYPYILARGGKNTNLCISTGIEHSEVKTSDVTVYPNPGKGALHIQSGSELGLITIYNTLGKIVYTGKSQGKTEEIELSHEPRGMYFLKTSAACIKVILE